MNDKNNDFKVGQSAANADKGKRSFIKKASVSVGVTALAPTSVWGACNSSGISGGSQDTSASCAMPTYLEGRDPAFWALWLRDASSFQNQEIVETVTTDISTKERFSDAEKAATGNSGNKRTYYYNKVQEAINNAHFTVTSLDANGSHSEAVISVASALTANPSSIQATLAAVYLNKRFNFSTVSMEYESAAGFQLLLDHYYGMSIHVPTFSTDFSARYNHSVEVLEHDLNVGIAGHNIL